MCNDIQYGMAPGIWNPRAAWSSLSRQLRLRVSLVQSVDHPIMSSLRPSPPNLQDPLVGAPDQQKPWSLLHAPWQFLHLFSVHKNLSTNEEKLQVNSVVSVTDVRNPKLLSRKKIERTYYPALPIRGFHRFQCWIETLMLQCELRWWNQYQNVHEGNKQEHQFPPNEKVNQKHFSSVKSHRILQGDQKSSTVGEIMMQFRWLFL